MVVVGSHPIAHWASVGASSPRAAGAPSCCGAVALDGKSWLEKKAAGRQLRDLGEDRSRGGSPMIPWFGGCGGHEGGTAAGPRCSHL
jgi:hypothetical protein